MDCRIRRDSLAFGTQENDSDYPPGMERCLKKLVLEAQATGFQGPKKGAGSRWDRLRENSCSEGSTGGKGVYIRYRREAKKFIPVHCTQPLYAKRSSQTYPFKHFICQLHRTYHVRMTAKFPMLLAS